MKAMTIAHAIPTTRIAHHRSTVPRTSPATITIGITDEYLIAHRGEQQEATAQTMRGDEVVAATRD
jgi:hypothetical protein